MNICLLTPTFLPKIGGVEIVVSSLADRYMHLGHRVVVVTQWPRRGKGTPRDEALPYPVVRYRRAMLFFWSLGWYQFANPLDRAFSLLPFDVLHCHLAYPTGPMARAWAKAKGIPLVMTTHGSDIRSDSRCRDRARTWNRICRSIQEADAVTAISGEMKERLATIAGNVHAEIPLIPNAVDTDDLANPAAYDADWPIEPGTPFIFYIGGLTHKKGVDVLLEAIAQRVRSGERPAKVVIAGDGADREKLMQLARDRRLNGHVQFLGKVNGNLKKYLFQNCRFVVMPSRTEGLPLVAIEAFSCGKPLLASSVGGLKDLLENRADLGLLVPPEEPRLLAQTLKRMEKEADGFPRESIRNFARQFNWPTVGQAYLDIYGKLIGKS